MSAPDPTGRSLLVLIDPAARRADGEAVRIARDVLSAAAATKICLPDSPAELARALARRGGRRPVVIGDDLALLRVVNELRRQETLADTPLSLVPVGTAQALAATLGVPTTTVAAARTALDGEERRMGLLVDDDGGVVLDALRLPAAGAWDGPGPDGAGTGPEGTDGRDGAGRAGRGGPAARGDSGAGDAPRTPGGFRAPGRSGAQTGPLSPPSGGPSGGPLAGLTQRGGAGTGSPGRRWTPAAGLRALAARAVAARAVGQRNGSGREPGQAPAVVTEWGAADATGGWESGGADGADGAGRTPAGGSGGEGAGWPPLTADARDALDHPDALDALDGPGDLDDADGPDDDTGPRGGFRLRIEADGVLLADLDRPAAQVRVIADPASGLAQVVVRPRGGDPLHAQARSVRVWGSDFRYRADALLSPPVSQRTWTAHPNAWRLITAPPR